MSKAISAKWIISATTDCLKRQLREYQRDARTGDTTARQTVTAIQAELDDRALQMEELESCLVSA